MNDLIRMKRSECAVLPLVLKGKWFDMITSGEKREEYRDATDYWRRRLFNWDMAMDRAPVVEFRHGYARDAERVAFWCMGLSTAGGMRAFAYTEGASHLEWGEPAAPHFVIRLGGRVELEAE